MMSPKSSAEEEAMSATTLLKRRDQMQRQPLERCHDGKGSLDFVNVLGGVEIAGRALRFLHADVLAPGVSIGAHRHDHEEYYYILSGRGTITLDGQQVAVGPGDVTAVYPGGSHGLENTGTEDMRVIVVGL